MEPVTKAQILDMAKVQLALDLACSPGQFDSRDNSIVESKLMDRRRLFSDKKDFFRMATFGYGAVISTDAVMMEWCGEYLLKQEGIRLFEHSLMVHTENELRKFGRRLSSIHEYYLPKPGFNRKKCVCPQMNVKWYEKEDIPQLYPDKRFKNALMYEGEVLRPDILAVAAAVDGEIVAMAGASMDSKLFWQIGIDVMPDYRNKGLATCLVSLLTDEILHRGAVPYYGTWSANIASRSVAAGSGYFPAWVEISAKEL